MRLMYRPRVQSRQMALVSIVLKNRIYGDSVLGQTEGLDFVLVLNCDHL